VQFSEISFEKQRAEIELYLKEEYKKANLLFTNASPYGQILTVLENLHQLSTLYLKKAQNNFDLSQDLTNNPIAVRNAAILAGHIPTRAISATGTIKLRLKGGFIAEEEIPGERITISNRSLIRNRTNNLYYSIILGSESKTYKVSNSSEIVLSIIQGRWERRTFTGTGQPMQTFSLDLRGTRQVENFNYEIFVNSQMWETKRHLYDMLPDERACVFKTGFNGGVDLIFGNGGFGAIPPIGSFIDVDYLSTDGSNGSLFSRVINDWIFVDDIFDGFGESVNIENIFDVVYETDLNFGANAETIEFTKSLLPISTNNFVLALPQQFAYEIKKLGVFSHVNAYEKDEVIYIVATPNIKLFKDKNVNYFTIDIEAFRLDDLEKNKILSYLKSNGNIVLTSKLTISSPRLSYYICNVFLITYEDAVEETVNSQVYDVISNYFLDLTRMDRVPKSDLLVSLKSNISEIHSVDISFISKDTEDYHRSNTILQQNRTNPYTLSQNRGELVPQPGYEPNKVIGLDPILGDIIFSASEIPLIRGGWKDRNDVYFSDDIDGSGLKSVNVIYKGKVPITAKQRI
jgi:hypothetical protein